MTQPHSSCLLLANETSQPKWRAGRERGTAIKRDGGVTTDTVHSISAGRICELWRDKNPKNKTARQPAGAKRSFGVLRCRLSSHQYYLLKPFHNLATPSKGTLKCREGTGRSQEWFVRMRHRWVSKPIAMITLIPGFPEGPRFPIGPEIPGAPGFP